MSKTSAVGTVLRRDVLPIPQNVSPDGTRCVMLDIPDDDEWEIQLFSVLTLLTKWNSYSRDVDKNAAIVSTLWRSALWNTFRHCDGTQPDFISEEDYEMSLCEQLRFSDGKLQALCCGVWTDISGQPPQGLFGLTGQEGGGASRPKTGGGCATYNGGSPANMQWLLPTIVNTGDTLLFSDFTGAATNNGVAWYCPDGETFFASACVGNKGTVSGDPASGLNHMTLIANISGHYYDVTAGLITVPSGVVNSQVIVQLNTSSIGQNSGSYGFNVTVCNNQTAPWCVYLDFTLSPNGFAANNPSLLNAALWQAGVGWVPNPAVATDAIYIRSVVASFTPTLVEETFYFTGSNRSDSSAAVGMSGSVVSQTTPILSSTSNQKTVSGTLVTGTGINGVVQSGGATALRIVGMKFTGTGVNPWTSSNC